MENMRPAQGKKVTVRELHGASFAFQLRLLRPLAKLEAVVVLNIELQAGSLFLQAFPDRCDINTFTQIFAGGLTVAQTRELGHLEGGN